MKDNKKMCPHFWVSYAKSLLRMICCFITLFTGNLRILIGGLIIAEFLGILEELVGEEW